MRLIDRTRFMGEAHAWPYRMPQSGVDTETPLGVYAPGAGAYEDVSGVYPSTPMEGEKLTPPLFPVLDWGGQFRIGMPVREPGGGGAVMPAVGLPSCLAGRGVVQVCSQRAYKPVWSDYCLDQLGGIWRGIYAGGGPRDYCDPRDYRTCGVPPWQQMPAGGRRFQRVGTRPIAGMVEGTEYTVLSFRVPFGWDGILITVSNQFNGLGFMDGSGSVHWRVMFDGQWFKDMGDVTITLGKLETPYELEGGGYRVTSGQTLRYITMLGAGALGILDPLGVISCACSGWFYPRS